MSDVDRGVYESFVVKAACHPSETPESLLTRVLAYCLEYAEGITFSRGGVSDPDDPALMVKDLTGAWVSWHKEPRVMLRAYEGQKIHKADTIAVLAIDRDLLAELEARLDRRMSWSVTVTDGELFVAVDDETLTGRVERYALPG
ncbi:MAG: YaeQ family protein [Gemmatimonadaceae bacterium]|nr:YaeQ family protein [Gemmatimonadaceae bacterium]